MSYRHNFLVFSNFNEEIYYIHYCDVESTNIFRRGSLDEENLSLQLQ